MTASHNVPAPPRHALLSVSDKTGIADFARKLVAAGWEIVSTGGTLATLHEAGIAAKSVSDITGFPEILDGRVKTLHPAVFAGVLARRHRDDDLATLKAHGLELFDLVAVNLYPFEATVADDPNAFDRCLEKIDIGGPSLLRAAAKSLRDVLVIVDPADYERVVDAMEHGTLPHLPLRQELAIKVFQHTSRYDASIANYLASRPVPTRPGEKSDLYDEEAATGEARLPAQLLISVPRVTALRYGENPHQAAALYADDGPDEPSAPKAFQLQGKELSYNNIGDGEGALELARELAVLGEPRGLAAIAIIKHANPCGAALASTVLEAYELALRTDPVSAFGSIVACSKPVDGPAALAMKELFIEAILAPSFDKEAREVFGAKKSLRLLETGLLPGPMPPRRQVRSVVGGYLVQQLDRRPTPTDYEVVTERQPQGGDLDALWFAWTVAKSVKSNAIVYSSSNATLGVGAGQMSRVDAARFGAEKAETAGLSLKGAYLASDAFFPFRDGVDVAARAGVQAIVQPGGSRRDSETIEAANQHGMLMIFTGRRHFRH